jgi:hypothetical protein
MRVRGINKLARGLATAVAVLVVRTAAGAVSDGEAMQGLSHRLIVGYQGWFGCPNDFEGNGNWQHWFVRAVSPQFLTVDILPSVRRLEPGELCDTGLPREDGKGTIKLFSAQNPAVVSAHFGWMREHAIDGAAAQRFIQPVASDPVRKRRSDRLLKNIQAAAEANGRVFFIVYDVSGADPQTVTDDVRNDWRYLVQTLQLTHSTAYLRDHGKPVIELWGFGLGDRPGTPESVGALIADLKSGAHGLTAATVIGGVPTHWRTLDGDAKPDAGWATVYRSYDVISPWAVGRFSNEAGADQFVSEVVQPDLIETRRLGLRYLPVVFPGFSWSNLMRNRDHLEQAVLNKIPRNCGKFLWRQISDLLQLHVDALYVAMFDEADEGTAIFPAETRADRLPAGTKMVYLDEDGCSLPDDWYLRITGAAAEYLHSSKVPPRQLDAVVRP